MLLPLQLLLKQGRRQLQDTCHADNNKQQAAQQLVDLCKLLPLLLLLLLLLQEHDSNHQHPLQVRQTPANRSTTLLVTPPISSCTHVAASLRIIHFEVPNPFLPVQQKQIVHISSAEGPYREQSHCQWAVRQQ
jgi:hypothetical protein